jgi:hypothetical protein
MAKRRKTEHISVAMEKIVDPFFLDQMGWIKPKNHFTPLSLQMNIATRQTVKHFFKELT